jgi:RNA polymerase sigma-70 factor (ECF subfamily)
MSLDPPIRDSMLAAVPSLRAFAISLCGNVDRADDLVQETLSRAGQHSFVPARRQHAGVAVHHPAQSVPLGVP